MTDERFTEWLRAHAAEYHAPPPTPADLVWSRLQHDVEQIVLAHRDVSAIAAKPWWRTTSAIAGIGSALLAASLMIGVAIGRWSAPIREGATTPHTADSSPPSSHVTNDPAYTQRTFGSPPSSLARAGGHDDGSEAMSTPVIASTNPSQASPARAGSGAPSSAQLASADGSSTNPGSVYVMTTDRHLADADALLTAFRSDVKAGRVDPALARWSRDLLLTTRVLYDAPATRDPRLKALLADLELVLMQLSAYQPGRASDLRLATQALDESDILPRLRQAETNL